ncbi:MAG: hypothetical protein WC624_04400 [Candidatus Margulisiibacteriota bacterium]
MGATPVGPNSNINKDAWRAYLQRRGVKTETANRLVNGESITIGSDKVTLTDGLDASDETKLGMTARTEDDSRMAAGWNVERNKDQTDGAKEIISDDEVVNHEATVKAYAEAHGIDTGKAATLYRKAPLGTENFAEVKANREKAEAELKNRYETWKKQAGNQDKTFTDYLVSLGAQKNYQIVQNAPKTVEEFRFLVFVSRFDQDTQKSVGVKTPISSSYPGADDYDPQKMLDWATGKLPSAPATTATGSAQTTPQATGKVKVTYQDDKKQEKTTNLMDSAIYVKKEKVEKNESDKTEIKTLATVVTIEVDGKKLRLPPGAVIEYNYENGSVVSITLPDNADDKVGFTGVDGKTHTLSAGERVYYVAARNGFTHKTKNGVQVESYIAQEAPASPPASAATASGEKPEKIIPNKKVTVTIGSETKECDVYLYQGKRYVEFNGKYYKVTNTNSVNMFGRTINNAEVEQAPFEIK